MIATISRFLDTGSLGNGGVTVVVNGMEVNALNVSASAVQQIRINQDPYSAEYSRPGRGRIEILTKPGTPEYHGDVNLIFRDARLNARNAFATTKPPEQRRIVEGVLRRTARQRRQDVVHAVGQRRVATISRRSSTRSGPTGVIQDTLPQSNGRPLVTGSITHQMQRQEHLLDSAELPVRERREPRRRRHDARQRRAPRSSITSSRSPTRSRRSCGRRWSTSFRCCSATSASRPSASRRTAASSSPVRSRAAARQGDLVRTETHINLNESLAWTHGPSSGSGRLSAAGLEPPRLLRSDQLRRHVLLRRPRRLRGRPAVRVHPAAGQRRPRVSRKAGRHLRQGRLAGAAGPVAVVRLRYDWQNYFHDNNNFAPRVSVAYAPGNKKTNVLRAGVGVFNDRSGPVVIADVLHSQPGGLTRYVDHRSRLSRSVRVGAGGRAAAEHRAARARRADSADRAVQRRPRSSAAEDDDAVGHLHRRARLSPVPVARRQRAAAAALPDAARSGVRRRPPGRIDRPSGDRLAAV